MASADITTLTFNVMKDSYGDFIEKLRKELAGRTPETVKRPKSKVDPRPVLARETAPDEQPLRWIHVELIYGDNGEKPKVAIRSDNAYIIGFTNRKGQWFQLSKTGTKYKLVDENAVMTGFEGSYSALIDRVDLVPTLDLCKSRMAEAAATLWTRASRYNNNDIRVDDDGEETAMLGRDPARKAVAILVVAICEAARLIPVCDIVKEGWSKDHVSVTDQEVGYIKDWTDLSTALLLWKKEGYKGDAKIFQIFHRIGITNGEDALKVVRLVKKIKRNNMASVYGDAPSPTEEQLLAYSELPNHGRYMAEVFAVRIPATAGGEPPRGTISFHGGHNCSDFIHTWSQPEEEHTSSQQQTFCDSQGNIVLTGPSVATSAYGPIVFSLVLHNGQDREADNAEEEENNTGRIVCDSVSGGFSNYNRVISETVNTGYGPTEVIYAILSNGVQALVDVKLARLQSSRDEAEDGVFLGGRIVARSKLFDVGCVLFYNEADKGGVRVRPGELLPLARHALAVPLHMPLTIELDLRRSSPSGGEVVRGQLEFKTAIDGLHTERLVGVNGAEFEFTILWSEYPW